MAGQIYKKEMVNELFVFDLFNTLFKIVYNTKMEDM